MSKSNLFPREWLPTFGSLLTMKFEEWRKDPHNINAGKRGKATREDFAIQIQLLTGRDTTHSDISKYCSGKRMPMPGTFKAMCKVLGCEEWELLPRSHRDKYEFDRAYMNSVVSDKARYAQSIGLREVFLEWISRTEFYKEAFPIYRELRINVLGGIDTPTYIPKSPAPAADVDSVFQVNYGGYTITLHDRDLDFLKELQDKVTAFVKHEFEEKQRQYDEELAQLNAGHKEIDKDGNEWTAF